MQWPHWSIDPRCLRRTIISLWHNEYLELILIDITK
jgi:hypothetical protein